MNSDLAALVDQVLTVLRRCPRFVVDDVSTRIGVENMIAAHPGRDYLAAAHTAVGWAVDPAWHVTAPVKVFELALQKQRLADERPAGRSKAERERDDLAALRRLGGAAS